MKNHSRSRYNTLWRFIYKIFKTCHLPFFLTIPSIIFIGMTMGILFLAFIFQTFMVSRLHGSLVVVVQMGVGGRKMWWLFTQKVINYIKKEFLKCTSTNLRISTAESKLIWKNHLEKKKWIRTIEKVCPQNVLTQTQSTFCLLTSVSSNSKQKICCI